MDGRRTDGKMGADHLRHVQTAMTQNGYFRGKACKT